MLASTLLTIFGLSATIIAAPTKRDDSAASLSAANLIGIAPATESCKASGEFADECRNATIAAHCINKSFQDYSIKSWGVQAALVSLIMFESGNFLYSEHHYGPGGVTVADPAGQGTRNMMSAANNLKYANYLASQDNLTSVAVETATNNGLDAVLDLLNSDDHFSFGSAAWYLMNQCECAYYEGLSTETDAAYKKYLVECVGTTVSPGRMDGYHAVQSLLHW